MESIITGGVAARRLTYMEKGWTAFKNGHYQSACSQFTLAENTSVGGLREKAEAKIASLYARFAARQYAEASNSLKWLTETYAVKAPTGQQSIADLIPDLPSKYGRLPDLELQLSGPGGLGEHIVRLETACRDANDQRDAIRLTRGLLDAKAIRAMVMFAMPDRRAQATFEAANLGGPGSQIRWSNLAVLFADSTVGTPGTQPAGAGTTVPKATSSTEFPFNLFQQAPPQVVGESLAH